MDNSAIYRAFAHDSPDRTPKDQSSRLQQFAARGEEINAPLDTQDFLADYAESLLKERGLSQNTVRAHVSTIRTQAHKLIESGTIKRLFLEGGMTELEAEAAIGRMLLGLDTRRVKIEAEATPKQAVKLARDQQVNNLLNSMEPTEPSELRDFTIIALMVTTGIGAQETVALNVSELRHEGQPVLHVPAGVGCVERLIPYGQDDWVLQVLHVWLQFAGIEQGAVFHGYYKGGRTMREGRLSSRAVEQLVGNYPVNVYNEPMILKPSDLRQAYARHLFRLGEDIDTIREHLGFSTLPPVHDLLREVIYENQLGRPFEVDLTKLEQWQEDDAN